MQKHFSDVLFAHEPMAAVQVEEHLCCALFDTHSDRQKAYRAHTLSKSERWRAMRFRCPRRRKQFITSRALLRSMFASSLGIPPLDVEIGVSVTGKPYLPPRMAPMNLQFSLSHSGPYTVVAFSLGNPVGVDIELVDPTTNYSAIMKMYFSKQERDFILNHPANLRARAFLQIWVAKEAAGKVHGEGLAPYLSVCTQSEHLYCLAEGERQDTELDVRHIEFRTAPNIACAVATPRRITSPRNIAVTVHSDPAQT